MAAKMTIIIPTLQKSGVILKSLLKVLSADNSAGCGPARTTRHPEAAPEDLPSVVPPVRSLPVSKTKPQFSVVPVTRNDGYQCR